MENKITSARLQDIEANLEIAKKNNVGSKIVKLQLPFLWKYTFKEWIKILEFERKQEIDKLKFFEKLKSDRKKK